VLGLLFTAITAICASSLTPYWASRNGTCGNTFASLAIDADNQIANGTFNATCSQGATSVLSIPAVPGANNMFFLWSQCMPSSSNSSQLGAITVSNTGTYAFAWTQPLVVFTPSTLAPLPSLVVDSSGNPIVAIGTMLASLSVSGTTNWKSNLPSTCVITDLSLSYTGQLVVTSSCSATWVVGAYTVSSGALLWTFLLPSGSTINSVLVPYGSVIVVQTKTKSNAAYYLGLTLSTGKVAWNQTIVSTFNLLTPVGPVTAFGEALFYTVSTSGTATTVYGNRLSDGGQQWQYEWKGYVSVPSPPFIPSYVEKLKTYDDVCLVGVKSSLSDYGLLCITPSNGKQLWEFAFPSEYIFGVRTAATCDEKGGLWVMSFGKTGLDTGTFLFDPTRGAYRYYQFPLFPNAPSEVMFAGGMGMLTTNTGTTVSLTTTQLPLSP